MKIAPKHKDEQKRIENLYEYKILDTLPEKDLDDFTYLASTICKTPIALISLVDKDRQWFKSKIGLPVNETSRDVAFCAHAILSPDVMMVNDAFDDERFADNPLVTGAPNVRFYAGAPLITPSGHNIGTLCVIDHVPRNLGKEELKCLSALARQVVNHFELRLQNESILRSSLLIESSPWAITCKDYQDRRGIFVEWNAAASHISGLKAQDALGKTVFDLYGEDIANEVRNEDLSIMQSNETKFIEKKMVEVKSGKIWVKTCKVPIKDKKGNARYLLSLSIDITKEIELENKLREINNNVQDAALKLEEAELIGHFGSWDYDLKNHSGFWSKGHYALLGLETASDNPTFEYFLSFVHPEDLPHILSKLNDVRSTNIDEFDINYRILLPSGEIKHIRGHSRVTRDNDGSPLKIKGTIQDVTLLKKLEAELIARTHDAESATKIKSDFLANMGHEIRTPMNAILGMSKLLLDTTSDEKQIEKIKIIQNSGDSLLHILNDILDFSKMEAGKMYFENKPYSLAKLANEVAELFRPNANDKKINLTYFHDESIPNLLLGDEVRLRQVFNNLVSNAIKFTNEGEIVIRSFLLEKDDKECKIQFSVQDSGIGIPIEFQNKLFKSFSQVDGTSMRRFGGTGLGLAICKAICEQMQGKIWFENNINGGATFIFYFRADIADAVTIDMPKKISSLAHDFPVNILVVDDNKINQQIMLAFLQKLGLKAEIANNGKEAIAILENKFFDIIFMDCHMPVMDGFQATEEIVKKYPTKRAKIVALTASTMQSDIDHCLKSGMDDFLAKPIEISKLECILQNFLQSKK